MTTQLTEAELGALSWLAAHRGTASHYDFRNYVNSVAPAPPPGAMSVIESLVSFCLVNRLPGFTGGHWYQITPAGVEAITSGIPEAAAQVTMCEHREPELPASTRATVCIDEADLDDWWDDLDVELKSAAFLNCSFGSARSEVDVANRVLAVSVPIVGVAGESAEEWNAMAGRLNGLPQTTLCYYCHLATPGALFLREAEISAHGSVLRRVCSDGDCMARWQTDYLAMGATIARGEDLQRESVSSRITLQDAERAGD